MYVGENKGFFPAAYTYRGGVGADNSPPSEGYRHWSGYVYGQKQKGGGDAVYRQFAGRQAFVCPSIPNGGLPPTNTIDENESTAGGATVDVPGFVDEQAPRISYTVNEAIMPRNKFTTGPGITTQRPYRLVSAARVKNSANTTLATEWTANAAVTTGRSDVTDATAMKSRRPIHAFESGGGYDLHDVSPSGLRGQGEFIRNCKLAPGYCEEFGADGNRLSWVGRIHYSRTLGSGRQDLRHTNFLYVDGHVEAKRLGESLYPNFQGGDEFYSFGNNGHVKATTPDSGMMNTF